MLIVISLLNWSKLKASPWAIQKFAFTWEIKILQQWSLFYFSLILPHRGKTTRVQIIFKKNSITTCCLRLWISIQGKNACKLFNRKAKCTIMKTTRLWSHGHQSLQHNLCRRPPHPQMWLFEAFSHSSSPAMNLKAVIFAYSWILCCLKANKVSQWRLLVNCRMTWQLRPSSFLLTRCIVSTVFNLVWPLQ